MKKLLLLLLLTVGFVTLQAQPQTKMNKPAPKYDTIIRKHVTKPVARAAVKTEVVIPIPEFINQPYYYDATANRIVKLEIATAQLVSKKKTLGLKGAKQFLSMNEPTSKARFTAKSNIAFVIKTAGDVIDLTSYIRVYKFVSGDQKREVTIASTEGVLSNKEETKGKLITFSVKPISKDNYLIRFADAMEAGEYGFVWVKNMELKAFSVFAFGIDWKNID